jgi:hypothetical protein
MQYLHEIMQGRLVFSSQFEDLFIADSQNFIILCAGILSYIIFDNEIIWIVTSTSIECWHYFRVADNTTRGTTLKARNQLTSKRFKVINCITCIRWSNLTYSIWTTDETCWTHTTITTYYTGVQKSPLKREFPLRGTQLLCWLPIVSF